MNKQRVKIKYTAYIGGQLCVRSLNFFGTKGAFYFVSEFIPRMKRYGIEVTFLSWTIYYDGVAIADMWQGGKMLEFGVGE